MPAECLCELSPHERFRRELQELHLHERFRREQQPSSSEGYVSIDSAVTNGYSFVMAQVFINPCRTAHKEQRTAQVFINPCRTAPLTNRYHLRRFPTPVNNGASNRC